MLNGIKVVQQEKRRDFLHSGTILHPLKFTKQKRTKCFSPQQMLFNRISSAVWPCYAASALPRAANGMFERHQNGSTWPNVTSRRVQKARWFIVALRKVADRSDAHDVSMKASCTHEAPVVYVSASQ